MADDIRENDVAVVGMACRFPGANNVREYWDNLVKGVEAIRFLTDDELRAAGVPERIIRDPDYVKACPMIDDMDGFDAAFFGYTARDAELRDPQGRLFLETCHSALEDAGYDVGRYAGTVGVFGGAGEYRYGSDFVRRNAAAVDAAGGMSVATATEPDYLATTVSYRLGLRGPSFTVQTACSTALVAIHLGCQSLQMGECDMALVGAVDVRLPYGRGHWRVDGGIGSADGHVRAFDAAASGTIFGSGVGVLAVKRLADARADGDHVYAVIRGSAINNDGADRAGYTAPGVEGQTRLIMEALAVAQVPPDSIGYVEAHGTGTLVGDPIEVTALSDAFRAAGAAGRQYCALGSVKTNVGHLGAAAGVAGIIKACLAVRHGTIPPTLHFQEPNPAIDFTSGPFYVNTEPVAWTGPRRAGVSSFGIGGTNAHIVLEEAPEDARVPEERPSPQVIPLSARTGGALAAMAARLAEHLGEPDPPPLPDVAWTLQHGRREFPYRRTVVASTVQDAAAALRDLAGASASTRPVPPDARGVALLFPGQGAQYPGMGAGLYRTQRVFRSVIDECAEMLEPLIGTDLRDLLYGGATGEALAQTRLAQPALFAVEYAVARLFASWGVVPDALLGHSVGEYAAACLAGVLSLEDAVAVVAARGELMQGMPRGSMAAVPLPEHLVVPMLLGGVEVAAVNGPGATVVAGPDGAVDAFEERLAPWGVRCGRLVTSHAFHSGMMDPIVEPFRERVARVRLNEPRIPFLSNVTGTWITAEQATDPGYWAGHLRSAVRFADCVRTLTDGADRVLLEAGPGRTLTGAARQCLPGARTVLATSMRHPLGEGDDETLALEALGRLWSAGVPVGWDGAAGGDRRRVPLPVYPFERRRYWLDPDPAGTASPDAEDPDEGALPVERAVYAPVWTERPIPAEIPPVPEGSRWLLLTPGTGPVEDLADRLEAEGARVVRVTAGPGFAETGTDRFTVRPTERDDYEALLGALGDGAFPTRVVHGWTATAAEPDPLAPEAVERACDLGFYALLLLAQALEDRLPDEPVRIVAVSTNMQDVSGEGANEPGKATLLGPAILMNRELRHVGCRSVDLAAPSRQPAEAVADRLLRECLRDDDADRQVAWRGLKRWAWSYTGVPVEVPEERPAILREGGTYLITGGLGGIGLTTARELARTVRANLVLLGRTAPPERETWPALLADDRTDEATRRLLGDLAEIEELGGTVLARSCDVTDEDALAAVVAEATGRFGRIDGVFHSAGVAGGGLLAVRDREAARRVLAPKVAGTLALHRVLGDGVDFAVLYSSITSVVGDFGQVDYCAANNFLDAYARRRAASGARVLSVSWGAWRDVGMAVDAARITPNVFREMRGGKWSEPADHPLLGRRLHDHLSDDVVFSTVLGPDSHWMLTDHRVGDIPLMPGSGCLEMIRAAAVAAFGAGAEERHVEMTDVVFLGPIEVRTDQEMRITLRPAQDGFHDVSFTVAPADADDPSAWTERVRARVRTVPATPAPVHDVEAVRAECADFRFEPTPEFRSRGIVDFGPHWYSVERVDIGTRRQLGTIALPEEFRAECGQYALHPGLFDDAVSNARVIEGIRKGNKYLPLSYRRILVRAPLPPRFHVDVRELDDAEGEIVAADIRVMAPDGTELAEIEQYALRRVDPASFADGPAEDAPAAHGPGAGTPAPGAGQDRADWMITPATGMDALRALLGAWGAAPHLVVCPEGLEANLRRVESLTGDVLERELGDGAAVTTADAQGERLLDTPYVAPETPLQQRIAALWSDAFGIREIGLDDDFAELGGNSLMAVQLAWRVRQHFDVEITVARLFRRPTVRALAELVENEQGAR